MSSPPSRGCRSPAIKPEDLGQVARDALMLQQHARPDIHFTSEIPPGGIVAPCDRRLIGQALTNLLQNAADAIASRPEAGDIALTVARMGDSDPYQRRR